MNRIYTTSSRLTAAQREALILWTHDAGARDLNLEGIDTASRVELEAYVVAQNFERAEAAA